MIKHLAIVPFLFLPALGANAAVMTFDDVSGDYTDFGQSLGDIAGLDVSNQTRTDFGNAATAVGNIDHWTNNYSELVDVAFAVFDGYVGELGFAPDSGNAITLTSFSVGSYFGGPSRDVTFKIFDASFNLLWDLVNYNISGNSDLINVNLTHNGPVYFQWGTDWNTGIDNFTYSVAPINTASVPLPAGLPLLGAGLAGLAALRRRRKA